MAPSSDREDEIAYRLVQQKGATEQASGGCRKKIIPVTTLTMTFRAIRPCDRICDLALESEIEREPTSAVAALGSGLSSSVFWSANGAHAARACAGAVALTAVGPLHAQTPVVTATARNSCVRALRRAGARDGHGVAVVVISVGRSSAPTLPAVTVLPDQCAFTPSPVTPPRFTGTSPSEHRACDLSHDRPDAR